MLSPSTGDYNLVESSACIDAGTAITTFSDGRYVGSAPDIGPFEAPIRLSAAVENATPTVYSVTYSMPSQSVRDGAGLLTCTVGNWAMVVAGAGATENSCLTTAATNRVDVTLNAAVTNGQSLTDAFTRSAVPTLTDSVGIGDPNGTLWTNFFNAKVRTHSATSDNVSNNVGGVASVLTSIHYRCLSWYSDTSPAATDWLHIEDASNSTLPCRVKAGGFAAVAIAIQNTTTAQTTGLDWYANRNGGAYAAMTNTASATAIAFAGVSAPSMADGASISATVLTMPDSYLAGKVLAQQASQPVIEFTAGSTTNAILLIKTDASTAVCDTFFIQAAKSGLTGSSVVPTQ